MKRNIYKAVAMVLMVLVLGSTAFAQPTERQYSESVFNQGMKVFPVSLKSEIPGIVESTIYNIVVLKSYFPDANYNKVIYELNKIANDNVNPSIRYKAHLASMYLTFGKNIKINPDASGYNHQKVFRQLSEQLDKRLLVSNTNE